jgi:hypothetical protein
MKPVVHELSDAVTVSGFSTTQPVGPGESPKCTTRSELRALREIDHACRSAGRCCTDLRHSARDQAYSRVRRRLRYPRDTRRQSNGSLTAFHGVVVPYGAYRNGQRPTPELPTPAVLRLQVFSTS